MHIDRAKIESRLDINSEVDSNGQEAVQEFIRRGKRLES